MNTVAKTKMRIFRFKKKQIQKEHENTLSLLNKKQIKKLRGKPSFVTCGQFSDNSTNPEKFEVNSEFIKFMHETISRKAIDLDSFRQSAKKQQNGWLYIIDFRTPNGIMGDVPPEDIIGAFEVKDGKVVENSYQRSTEHKIFTKNGIVQLPKGLDEILIKEIINAADQA